MVQAFAVGSCHLLIYPEIGLTSCIVVSCFTCYPVVLFLMRSVMRSKSDGLHVHCFHAVDLSGFDHVRMKRHIPE